MAFIWEKIIDFFNYFKTESLVEKLLQQFKRRKGYPNCKTTGEKLNQIFAFRSGWAGLSDTPPV